MPPDRSAKAAAPVDASISGVEPAKAAPLKLKNTIANPVSFFMPRRYHEHGQEAIPAEWGKVLGELGVSQRTTKAPNAETAAPKPQSTHW